MNIDMQKYNMVYKNRVYKCLSLMYIHFDDAINDRSHVKLSVIYIDENNMVQEIEDERENFQFVINNKDWFTIQIKCEETLSRASF